jgi:hypothetical protein
MLLIHTIITLIEHEQDIRYPPPADLALPEAARGEIL